MAGARRERCVAKLAGDNNIVTEVMNNPGEPEVKRGRSWRHVQVLYVISVFSLGEIIITTIVQYPELLISSTVLSVLHSVTLYYLLTGGPAAPLSSQPREAKVLQEICSVGAGPD